MPRMPRLRLFSMHSLLALFKAAGSTSWPGASRFAVHTVCFCLIIAIAQLGVSVAVGASLLRVGTNVVCKKRAEKYVVALPVTFASRDSIKMAWFDYMSMHENRKKVEIIFATIMTPLLIVLLLSTLITMHFFRVSNRSGMLFATCLLGLFITFNAQDYWLNIDAKELHTEYTWCWKSRHEMKLLWADRIMRYRLLLAGEVLSGVGGLFVAFYFALAIIAASINRTYTEQQPTRLRTFRSSSSFLPARPIPNRNLTATTSRQSTPTSRTNYVRPNLTYPRPVATGIGVAVTVAEKRETVHPAVDCKAATNATEETPCTDSTERENPFHDRNSIVKLDDTAQEPTIGKAEEGEHKLATGV